MQDLFSDSPNIFSTSDKQLIVSKITEKDKAKNTTINIANLVPHIQSGDRYFVTLGIYVKRGQYYLNIGQDGYYDIYPAHSEFNFTQEAIYQSFELRYAKENNTEYDSYYYGNSDMTSESIKNEVLKNRLYSQLDTIFSQLKTQYSQDEYLGILYRIKGNIFKIQTTQIQDLDIYSHITTREEFEKAYKTFSLYKNKQILLSLIKDFISNEIYKEELKNTVEDIINQ